MDYGIGIQELIDAVRIAANVAGGVPASVVVGERVVGCCRWSARLSGAAVRISKRAAFDRLLSDPHLGVSAVGCRPCAHSEVLVVAAVGLSDSQAAKLTATARLIATIDSARFVADLYERMEQQDPCAIVEFRRLLAALRHNIANVAALFGISRPTLYKRLADAGVSLDRLRASLR